MGKEFGGGDFCDFCGGKLFFGILGGQVMVDVGLLWILGILSDFYN